MWTAQHKSVSTRNSAKNIDLRIATLKEHTTVEPTPYPHPSEMWLGKHQRSQPSVDQHSIPSLSPRSSSAQEDDTLSHASESTAFSTTHSSEQHTGDSVHVHILSADRYEPSMEGVDIEAEISDVAKSPFVNILDEQEQIPRSLEPYQGQESSFIELPRITAIPDSPPLTARAIESKQQNPPSPSSPDEPPGPLQEQLLSMISKIKNIESSAPTIMASDYNHLQQRITNLKAENATLLAKRESLFALRDEDVANLIKLRVLLAQERRQHEAIRKLRDEDLQNVIQLRNKLAQATWANQSSLISSSSSSINPPSSISYRRMEKAQSLSSSPQSNDLWQTAKTAALEQRVFELESANADLRERLKNANFTQKQQDLSFIASGGGAAGQLDTVTSHQPRMAALADLCLRAMRDPDNHKIGMEDIKAENLKLGQQVEKMRYQLEISQAVIECFSEALKRH